MIRNLTVCSSFQEILDDQVVAALGSHMHRCVSAILGPSLQLIFVLPQLNPDHVQITVLCGFPNMIERFLDCITFSNNKRCTLLRIPLQVELILICLPLQQEIHRLCMSIVRRIMQWRPFSHVSRIHNNADVCGLAQVNGITFNMVRHIKYFLFEYLVLDQLRNGFLFFVA